MFAIMVDRSPLSLRLLAWAAVAVMATTPESVLGPSFQMSFGAVLGLLAFYEKANRQVAAWRADRGRWIEPVLYAYGVTMATVIATLATAPFGLYHFQRLATYGGVSNLLAIPLTSFWIMPLVLLTYPLLPFGLEELAVVPMGWGVTAMLWVADIAAGWPGSVVMVPPMPVWGFGSDGVRGALAVHLAPVLAMVWLGGCPARPVEHRVQSAAGRVGQRRRRADGGARRGR